MQRRLPPLNSLRAFESAARLLSFTRAADELSVTQSAVSHQVKALEDWAGIPLFRRDGRQVALTEAAAKFLPTVTAALDQIALAGRKLQAVDPGQGWLTVAMMPSFAAWGRPDVMSVAMKPGATALTVMPREAYSFASVFVNPIRAAFDAA